MIHNRYHINSNVRPDSRRFNKLRNLNREKFSLDIFKKQKAEPTNPQVRFDYAADETYSNELKETVLDETTYEQAMSAYFNDKAEYESKMNEQNAITGELQKQDIVNKKNEESELFNQRLYELQTELDTNGTNSRIMTFIMNDLSAEYEELLENKKEEEFKIVDNIVNNNLSIPNAPFKTDSVSDEEYELMLKKYNLERLSYEKLQLEQEIQKQLSELKINKINSELEKIRRLLFGNADLTKVYYETST